MEQSILCMFKNILDQLPLSKTSHPYIIAWVDRYLTFMRDENGRPAGIEDHGSVNSGRDTVDGMLRFFTTIEKSGQYLEWQREQGLIALYIYYDLTHAPNEATKWPLPIPYYIKKCISDAKICDDAVKNPENPMKQPIRDSRAKLNITPWLGRISEKIRTLHYLVKTEKAYRKWTARFLRFHPSKEAEHLLFPDLEAFISHLAQERQVAAKT